jgi:hypothetical protein
MSPLSGLPPFLYSTVFRWFWQDTFDDFNGYESMINGLFVNTFDQVFLFSA